MDPFAVVLIVAFVLFIGAILLLGIYYPGSGIEQVGLRSARQIIETREELDALDLDQMLVAHNKRRVAKGEAELSADEMERRVMQDMAEQRQRQERFVAEQRERRERRLADEELEQLLQATNARRRKRGLPERSRAEAEEELGRPESRSDDSSSEPPLQS